MQYRQTTWTILLLLALAFVLFLPLSTAAAQDYEPAPDTPNLNSASTATCPVEPAPAALLAGDSWAQFMWDDGSHNDIFDKFGHADMQMISRSLDEDPGPGYTGSAYAVSGSEARQWANTVKYPWIGNVLADLEANPTITTVVLSIDGNDFLAGKPGGGWYKDMDLDVAGSEDALFDRIEADTWQIINAIYAVRPDIEVLLSSYEYPNFNVGAFCSFYACPKRDELSRDPANDLISDVELNGMMVNVEQRRIGWTNSNDRLFFDNSVGLMHYFYGDGVSAPGQLPYPGQAAPDYAPFPGGNALRPTLRENFRPISILGLDWDADPIHLDYDGYQYKISNQTMSFFFPRFRGEPTATFYSLGAGEDGWTDGAATGTDFVTVGSVGGSGRYGLISIDTSSLPDDAVITGASLYLMRQSSTGTSPFQSGALGTPVVDVASGSFGAPAVEAADASAAADAENAGCTTGTVRKDDYALRINLTANGLYAINPTGRTQFRVSFPNPSAASNAAVSFSGSDGVLRNGTDRLVTRTESMIELMPNGEAVEVQRVQVALEHQGLAEYMGSPRPFLDVEYCLPQEAGCYITQDISLVAGWNTISSYVAPSNPAMAALLADIENGMTLIKNGGGEVYWPAENINDIGDWDVNDGYQIHMKNEATLSITGQKVNPTQKTIGLLVGWNLISYLRDSAMPVDLALDDINVILYLVKNNEGQTYWPYYNVDQIGEMQPGRGYHVYVTADGELTYPGN